MGRIARTSGLQMEQTSCQRAFADGFHDEPAGNIMAVSDHTRDDSMLTLLENMESTIYLLTEWTLKASGLLKGNSIFLIRKGACAVVDF